MRAARFTLFTLTLALAFSTGCTHTQLAFNTIQQSNSLMNIYERQVLDNLAMFAVEPNALPRFAVPTGGTSNVTDNGKISANPLNAFRKAVGLEANRSMQEAWTLSAVTDPDKLKRMRCAYQRAVGYSDPRCIDCCKLEKEWRGKPDRDLLVFENGKQVLSSCTQTPLKDPFGNEYVDISGNVATDPRTGEPYTHRRFLDSESNTETIVICNAPQFDCEEECAVQPCFYCVGRWIDVPLSCRKSYGHYKGTYIWIPAEGRDEFSRLVLSILDYAQISPPKKRTKLVSFYIDSDGTPTTRDEATGAVAAEIAFTDPPATVLGDAAFLALQQKRESTEARLKSINSQLEAARQTMLDRIQRLGFPNKAAFEAAERLARQKDGADKLDDLLKRQGLEINAEVFLNAAKVIETDKARIQDLEKQETETSNQKRSLNREIERFREAVTPNLNEAIERNQFLPREPDRPSTPDLLQFRQMLDTLTPATPR